jgi:RHS repeat-associated protein
VKRATDIFPGLKSALALANSSGSIVESYVYDAYGNVTIRNGSGTVIPTSAFGNRFLFQGREYDYTTQLYHFRARWYDPETGRWLSNDPIGISGGLNLYAFCSNDPVNFVDPMGTYSKNKQGVIRISYELENGESEVKYLYIIKDFVEFFRKVDPNNKITWMKITAHGLKTSPGTILLGDGLISDLNHQYCGEPEGTLGIKNENISSCFANAFSPNADIILKACFGADLAYSINSIRNDLNVVGYTGIVHAPLGILKFAAWGYGKVTY